MKITFIDPTKTVINYGLRTLSNLLVKANYDVSIIFMNQPSIQYDYDYPESIYHDLYELVKDSDLIGFSFVSNYFGQAKRLTGKLKSEYDIPIIWGGVHATAAPEQSLEFVDFICVGEGEDCMIALLESMKNNSGYQNVPNLLYKKNGSIFYNEIAHINSDIDSYSTPLYDQGKEFIRRGNNIVPMDQDIRKALMRTDTNYYRLKDKLTYPYLTLTSRGCPNSCSYCFNNLFKKIYTNKGKLIRRRSNTEIIKELESVTEQMPYINLIEFFDDDFIYTDITTLSEFALLYKQKINLPFRCNCRPESVTYDKIKLLSQAGLISVELGLQSASAKTNKLYRRHFNRNSFLNAADILNKFIEISVHYDIIVDNPFEGYEDIKHTLRFIAELPTPYKIAVYSLTFFPGTQLYEYAKTRGLLKDEVKNIFNKKNYIMYEYKQPYIKFLILYIRQVGFKNNFTRTVFKFMTNKFALILFDSYPFYPIWIAVIFSKRVLSKIKHPEIELFPN